MKVSEKIIIGATKYATSRAFIPIIQMRIFSHESITTFDAHALAIIFIEEDAINLYPFFSNINIEDVRKMVPSINDKITEAKNILHNLPH